MPTVAHYVERWLELSAGFVAAQVARSRHRSVVITRDGWEHLDAFPAHPRFSLHHLRNPAPERWKSAVLRGQLTPLLAVRRVRLVHVHFGYAANDVVGLTGPRRPYVLSLHGHDVTGLPAAQPHHYDRVTPAVDAVIVPSRFLAERAERAGFHPALIRVIPSGVDTSFFTPSPLPDGPPVIAFVGRLVEKKGLDVLLAAWPRICAQAVDARLVVLGDGPLAHLMSSTDRSVTHLLPEPDRRHEQVRDLIRSAAVVVTPSRTAPSGDSESLLLVNLEAAASGRPVVSTRHGGIPEYVDADRTGLLVAENSSADLADAVLRVLEDRDLAGRLATSAVDHAAQWDVARCAARVDDLYDELLARRT
jgi:glycosyltransferase involved in cell wall biosynthesis